jgi:hypothetical protein
VPGWIELGRGRFLSHRCWPSGRLNLNGRRRWDIAGKPPLAVPSGWRRRRDARRLASL